MAVGPQIREMLARYGLSSLVGWASTVLISGFSPEEIELELRKRPEFRARFPAIFALEAAGKPPISVDEYLSYENTVHSVAAMWGYSLTKTEVDNLLTNLVSPVEFQARNDLAVEAMFESPTEVISELQRMSGADPGNLIKFFMNPKTELPKMQSAFRQAQIAGTALRTGWGQLTQTQSQRLYEAGLDVDEAEAGFGQLMEFSQIFEPIDITEEAITSERQVEFLAGNVEESLAIRERQRKRLAEFGGGGGFAAGEAGFAVGAAPQQ